MRRSCAPSMREKQKEYKVYHVPKITGPSPVSSESKEEIQNFFFDGKVVFKAVWRDISTKKHKTWKGDGIIHIDLKSRRAVLKDHLGKYIGSSIISKDDTIEEDLQLTVGGKEVELLEQIKDKNEYFGSIKRVLDEDSWGEKGRAEAELNEMKKPKGSFVFRPSIPMESLQMPKIKENESYQVKRPKMEASANMQNDISIDLNIPEAPISPRLMNLLRPHQIVGVQFLYNCLMGYQVPGYFGCILADEMGLGKTLQCLAAAHAMLRTEAIGNERTLQRILIVTPSTLTVNWNNEVTKWLKSERIFAFVVGGKHKLNSYSLQSHIPFVIVSYESLNAHVEEFKQLQFDVLICDEGHRLKNEDTKIHSTLCDLNIKRRLIMTGTPVQNDLQEFFTLANFVNPGIFGTHHYFRKYYEVPIEQSQSATASEDLQHLGAERSAELNEISSGFLLRRSQAVNRQYLKKKQEYICFVRPSDLQQLMLQKVLDLYQTQSYMMLNELNPFQIITLLKKICNNPSEISHIRPSNFLVRKLESLLHGFSEMSPKDSSKMQLVEEFLYVTAVERHEKCVLVSNYTQTLNALQGLCDYMEIKCLRLDGSTPMTERNRNVEQFNCDNSNEHNEPLVFLLSAKAGGVGLNLIGASRLILFDNDWNPATDAQAISRIWRDGQQNDVQIYRLITAGCIEEKIFQRQTAKISLGDQVLHSSIKHEGDSMKFTKEELLDLFSLQYNYDTCLTHDSLNCDCNGDGQNLISKGQTSDAKEINELMRWQHYGAPFDEAFLEEACLSNASDTLVYIFVTRTD